MPWKLFRRVQSATTRKKISFLPSSFCNTDCNINCNHHDSAWRKPSADLCVCQPPVCFSMELSSLPSRSLASFLSYATLLSSPQQVSRTSPCSSHRLVRVLPRVIRHGAYVTYFPELHKKQGNHRSCERTLTAGEWRFMSSNRTDRAPITPNHVHVDDTEILQGGCFGSIACSVIADVAKGCSDSRLGT